MQIIGLTTVVLFLASLASFLVAFYRLDMVRTGTILGSLFFAVAILLLGFVIRNRNKTERI